jgi:hypothetical protein
MSERIGNTDGEFSVAQFFEDGSYEYVRRWIGAEEAVKVAKHYTESIAARLGVVEKVVITDGGDCTNFMWERGKGITFPKRDATGRFA